MGIKNFFFKTRSVSGWFISESHRVWVGIDFFFLKKQKTYVDRKIYMAVVNVHFFWGGTPYSLKTSFSCIILFDACNKPIKLGKIVIRSPFNRWRNWDPEQLNYKAEMFFFRTPSFYHFICLSVVKYEYKKS